jgi:hypothetical protein
VISLVTCSSSFVSRFLLSIKVEFSADEPKQQYM